MPPLRRRAFLKGLACFAGMAAAAEILQGCGGAAASSSVAGQSQAATKSASSPPSSEASKVRFGSTASNDIMTWLCEDKGFFQQQGLRVESVSIEGADLIPPLGTGQVDVGAGISGVGLDNAFARGVGIHIVAEKANAAPGQGTQAIVVRKDLYDSGQIRGPEGMKGRLLAMPNVSGTASEVSINAYMQRAGAKARDVNLTLMRVPDMLPAMANKSIDLAWASDPYVGYMVAEGTAQVLAWEDDLIPYHTGAVLLYSALFSQNQPAVARAFMTAYLGAARFYNDAMVGGDQRKKEEIIDILFKHQPIKDRGVYERMRQPGINPDGKPNIEGFKGDQEYYIANGLQKERADIDKLVDPTFAQYAVGQLGGPYKPPAMSSASR
jgi:NitT/TauT family transport system substrate-binding protein